MGEDLRRSGLPTVVAGFFGLSMLAGVLVTAMVTPAVAVTSQTAEASIAVFDKLPDYLALGSGSQQNTIYATRAGAPVQIATIYNQNRQEVAWDAVSPFLKNAAVAGEDRRFYKHGGVDVESVARAAIGNIASNGITSGSSTLDMQLVKNILVQQALQVDDPKARQVAYQAAIDDTLQRKLKEMKLAIGLDKEYPKKQILLAYLNITGFGGNTYGVESAARQYFSVPAKDVTLPQAASLIAIVQQPNRQNLSDPKYYKANKVRRDQILTAMYDVKDITKKQFDEAIATPIASEVKITPPSSGCLYAVDAKFACDYVKRLVPSLASLGPNVAARTTAWATGGYKIYTSIDLDQQDAAQAALSKSAPANESRFALGASAVSVQPGTGKILIMAQNKEYDNSASGDPLTTTAVNLSTDRSYGGSSGFPTGSTYKIFTLTDWLQNGHGLNDVVNGSVRAFPQSSFKAPCDPGALSGSPYAPKNDSSGEGGSMTVLNATKNSVNAAFVAMAQKLDLCDIRADATAMGVHRADDTPKKPSPLHVDPSSVLGTNEIAPLTMAAAIATIGANGLYCAPTMVDKIVGPDGKELAGQQSNCSQTITAKIASTVAYALSAVMKSGTGAPGAPRDGVPIVGKTGTTDDSYHNWLIASTTKAALAVWVGNIQGTPGLRTPKNPQGDQSLRNISIAGTNGYNTKFNIFRATMKSLDSNPAYKGGAFPLPDQSLLKGRGVPVPDVTGQQPAAAKALLESLQFTVADGGTVPSSVPAGQVARTDPPAGTVGALGDTITVYTSDGTLATTMPDVVGNARAAAVTALEAAGFAKSKLSYSWVSSAPADLCKVLATNPAAGAKTGTDASVVLTVGNGGSVNGSDPGPLCP
ncbi:transglycosylase domain-containing protein [Lacisediminihabitans profunda]|uniref:PASTA domain-containing protein n=1 Tax=Lacisediminihabitans profunda TaxID=2594790 RepID=A0A5C8UJY3_9MICO|nr:transglycosylase domain-containing protein [Lacisediminihabitans profunda]TXN28386.1 PASTA domain-containing protein [Lacisediminihabitans profunda]